METIEMNKVISIFMDEYDDFHWGRDPFNEMFKAKYHSDWNELMKVVEKIETLGHRFTISTTFVRVYHNKDEEYHTSVFEGKLNTTYYAVYQFIMWYNQNNSK